MVIKYFKDKGWVVLLDIGCGKVDVLTYNTLTQYPNQKGISSRRRVYHKTYEEAKLFGNIYHDGLGWEWLR